MKLVRGAWKILVGIKGGLVLLFMLVFFGALFAALSAKPNAGTIRDGALVLKLDGPIVEQPANPTALAAAQGATPDREFRLRDLVRAIDTARDDARVKVLVLDLDSYGGGYPAAVTEVSNAIGRFKTSGKKVLAYATAYTDGSYLLASNASEIWVVVGAVAVGLPSPLTPLQLLWLNLVTDIAPGLGLAVEPREPDLMTRPPRDPQEPIILGKLYRRMLIESAVIAGGALAAYGIGVMRHGLGPVAQTLAFASLLGAQLLHVPLARAGDGPTFIEAKTYRFRGHSMSDPMKYRSKEEAQKARERDPIVLYESTLKERGWVNEAALEEMHEKVKAEVEEAIQFAENAPEPAPEALYEDITLSTHIPQE